MQIFELHFNPKLQEDQIFDSFVYEPENSYERRLGSLYLAGEIKNALPHDARILDNLARALKSKYYALSAKTPEKALSEGLKKANDFLGEELKKENLNWLGNLSFAALSLKDYELVFTKTGPVKIILIRAGQIIDIGKNLDPAEIEPYPLKVFFNIVSGRLTEGDLVLILTKKLFDFLSRKNILTKISKTVNLDEKMIKEAIPNDLFAKDEGATVSGLCLLLLLTKAKANAKTKSIGFSIKRKPLFLQKLNKKIRVFKKKLSYLLIPFRKIKEAWLYIRKVYLKLKKISLPKISFKKRRPKLKFSFPKFSLPKFSWLKFSWLKFSWPKFPKLPKLLKIAAIKKFTQDHQHKNNLILIAALLFLLLLGFLIF